MQRFENITKVQVLKTIQVCEGPLTAESKINSMTHEEFSKKFGFEYTENLVCNYDLSESDQKEILSFATEFNPDIRPYYYVN